MRERDSDLKAREQRATNEALKETAGHTPGSMRMWGESATPPPHGVAAHLEAPGTTIVPGRGKAEPGRVVSTWDTRPVNARDFQAVHQYNSTSAVDSRQSAVYRVPQGYVAIVRALTYFWTQGGVPFNLQQANVPAEVTVDLFVDNTPLGVFDNFTPSPPPSNEWFGAPPTEETFLPLIGQDVPVFALAAPGSLIELRAFLAFGTAINVGAGYVSFRGTLRETRGIPYNFEVQS